MAISKEKKKEIDGLMSKINKQFGSNSTSYLADKLEELKIKFWKTPSHEVNAMLYGGVAKSKIVELYGQNSSGKTSLALEVIGKAMTEDPDFMAAWIETEKSLDSDYLRTFGIDPDRLIVIEQSEELPAEKCMDIIRSLVNSKQFGIVVLNSVAALVPSKEIEDDLDKQNMALTARLLSKFLRVITASLATTNTTLILINQVRQNIGSLYGGSVTTGGLAIPFYATQRIEMKKERIMAGDVITENDGVKVRCRVIKNRVARGNPYKMCNYYALYGIGIDGVSELGSVLVREEVLTKAGAWLRYQADDGDVLKVPSEAGEIDGKWNGMSKFTDYLRANQCAVEFFENKLNEKIADGSAGISISKEEIEELEKLNSEIDKSEVAATEEV